MAIGKIKRWFENRKIKKKNKKLLKKYPILMPHYLDTVDGKYDYSFTDLDLVCIGWQNMFLELCDQIQRHLAEQNVDLSRFWFSDIKEKWGCLRIDAGGYNDDAIEDMFVEAEMRSMLFCPSCGKPTKYVTSGYVLYVCPDCFKESKLNGELLTHEDIPQLKTYRYEEDGKQTVTVRKSAYNSTFEKQWNGKE